MANRNEIGPKYLFIKRVLEEKAQAGEIVLVGESLKEQSLYVAPTAPVLEAVRLDEIKRSLFLGIKPAYEFDAVDKSSL